MINFGEFHPDKSGQVVAIKTKFKHMKHPWQVNLAHRGMIIGGNSELSE
ncbi:hypothetical protein [Carboxylicivirga sp. M1479]|nr:hypothetical protein [Carboxylicivirga sp. M1479]